MSDEAALLAAIGAHPDEDTPRLVYADWLDEHGRAERAEFIRLQCLPDAGEAQLMREAELEERNRGRWLTDLLVPQFAEAQWTFRRGFPEHLHVEVGLFLDRYDAFVRVPWLRYLSIHGVWSGGVRDFCHRVWPSQWNELSLFRHIDIVDESDYSDIPSLIALANCPQIQQLRRLRLSGFDSLPDQHPALSALREQLADWLVID